MRHQSVHASGPSPRGWGNRIVNRLGRLVDRAIPTRVGKSVLLFTGRGVSPGHPHAGGEIHPPRRSWSASLRAIPTRVGKSVPTTFVLDGMTGHPHAGGEIVHTSTQLDRINGPSPRGWGNPSNICWNLHACRAIPTRVGKSGSVNLGFLPSTGHPHAGGEISSLPIPRAVACGPSPRGWGNPVRRRVFIDRSRAIPTRVGKSSPQSIARCGPTGHPHAGGEIDDDVIWSALAYGPSPRGWGNRGRSIQTPHGLRAIPTRVGKSPCC